MHGGVKLKSILVKSCADCPYFFQVNFPPLSGCRLDDAAELDTAKLPGTCPLRSGSVKIEADPSQLHAPAPATKSAPPACPDCGGRGCISCTAHLT